MTHPWDGPRHRSWASNTVLTLILLVVCIIVVGVSDYFGEPPNYLVGLLGTAAGAFFTALGGDKSKRDAEVRDTAVEAKTKVEEVERRVTRTETRADEAEAREHIEHPDDGGMS